MSKTVAQPVQQYAYLNSIARARQHGDIQNRKAEILSSERSAACAPINAGGWNDPGRAYMQSQISQQVAQKREELRRVEALDGDELCLHYCGSEIAQNEAPPVRELRNSDGSPLARGASPSMVPPGMF